MKAKVVIPLFVCFAVACNNNEISVPTLRFDGMRGNVSVEKVSQYDVTEEFGETVPDELEQVTIVNFDDDGNLLSSSVYDKDGDCIYRVADTYENGKIVSESYYQRYNDQKSESRVVLREKNHLRWVRKEGTDESYSDVYYDGLSCKFFDEDGTVLTELVFDKKGHILEQKAYSDGEQYLHVVNEFNKKGSLSKTTQYYKSGDPDITTYTYTEFDRKGNWTTRLSWEDDEVVQIDKREITYR